MNQKILNINLPQERSFEELKKFGLFTNFISEIETFLSNKDKFFLFKVSEDLIRNYLIQASYNSFLSSSLLIHLNDFKNFNMEFNSSFIFIDNITKENLNAKTEVFLFNAFNFCLDNKIKIIFSCSDFVKNLKINLPDLESRLNTIAPTEIKDPSEEEKIALITFELNQRGLKIGKRELNYIFNYHSRDLDSLLMLANQLDKVSLEKKKSITTNLIKEII